MTIRYSGKVWGDRFLPRLSSTQIQKMPKKDSLIILPIGAVEQHGPHLPVFTDTLLAETVLEEALKYVPSDSNIWVLPSLPYGKSNEHLGRAGTFSLSSTTLQSLILDIGRSLKQNGFRRLLLFNAHGGNSDLLNLIAREVRLETDLMVFRLNVGGLTLEENILNETERLLGIHGGDYETSLIMASYPDWVREDELPVEYPELLQKSKFLRFQKSNFAWTIDDVSSSGILGNAKTASAEKGRRIYEQHGKEVAEILLEMMNFEIDSLMAKESIEIKK
ncbi:creatininase family protein [Neobacillus mesonae]|uniref:creatininase family protein n=1 Tax=Neobacillus mesonae TaxID=1193713 RepID=UPI002574708A|nr:creatininase family protein [Neobacillus mesonae]MED4206377.1 creatininase family protein [Neobacillus mesonae]